MKTLTSPLVALAIGTLCSLSAEASTVTFTDFAHGSQTVTATLSSPNGPLVLNNVSAGGFATTLDGGPSFESYCVDLYQTISFNTPYTDYLAPVGFHHFTNRNAYADLGRLYGIAGLVNTALQEAAFQIAVWEIAYEDTGTPYSLSSGSATFAGGTADSSGALTLAASWLSNLGNGSYPSIGVLDSPGQQDVIFAPIPEPSTYLLMALGLMGLGFVAQRRSRSVGQSFGVLSYS
ncbi:MAG: PEP-CTERM sorting domain-containing protein [Pseudomonadota bacterium]|nr:PEP-CTERM sorting domain-containing protein [Pseudomonadota bacterium]